MTDNTTITPPSLSQLFKWACSQQRAIVTYRLPGEAEPITLLQNIGQAGHLADPFDAIGMKGFVLAPWIGDTDTPAILINPHHQIEGWNPDIQQLVKPSQLAVKSQAELPLPTVKDIPFAKYQQQLQTIQQAIHDGAVEKAILSRIASHTLPKHFDAVAALQKACMQYPNAFCYLAYVPGIGQWMGASPEVLVSLSGHHIKTVALAGTRSNKSLNLNELNWSIKEMHEHELVRSSILGLLQQYATDVVADGPKTIQAGNLFHLRTDFTATLPDTANGTLKHLLQAMHPTPAISGFPKEAAIKLIGEVEPHQRAYYAGFIGPVNGDDVRLFVNLRCMRIVPQMALLYVGGGITEGSVAQDEWQETIAKADTLLNVLQ